MTQQPPSPPFGQGPGRRPTAPGQPPHYAAFPPQPAYAPPPQQPPRPSRPVTTRWWFWVILTVVGLAVLGQCSEATRTRTTASATASPREVSASAATTQAPASTAPAAPAPASTAPAPAGLNTAVTDRDLEFTVTGFACGVTVKDAVKTLEPQGKFCRIRLTAKNVGSRQTTLSDQQITLEDATGTQYSASSDTWLVEGSMFLKAINPGNTLSGVVVIDVPKQVTPTVAVLRAGTYSRGVRVALPRT